ncbi:MAG: sensor histidine kinase [Candidatus Kapaibacteriota bacterium]
MHLTLRTRLALLYGGLVAITVALFGVVAYWTVSRELYANLDASLKRAAASLQAVIQREQDGGRKPLTPIRRGNRASASSEAAFEFLQRSSMRDFVGPIPVPASLLERREDPVWSAVYEHVLLNASSYALQASTPTGEVMWRSDNLLVDTLPTFEQLQSAGERPSDGTLYSYATLRNERYRIVSTRDSVASITAAYPVRAVDETLQSLFAILLYSIPIVLLGSVLLGWFLARRALRPVDVIAQRAQRITAERLSDRLPVLQSNDEIGRLTAILNEMIARLERSFDQIRQFTSDASHELKTPLAILMGELEVALRKEIPDEDVRHTLQSCLEEVVRLTHVVQGLLDLSRAESGQLVLELHPIDLSDIVRDITEDVVILAEPKQIRVESHIDPHVEILGDAVRLHQALLNVIENAIKYTPAGGTVVVALHAQDHEALVTVRDTGSGIPEDQIHRIFDRFFRVDKARSSNIHGTGLGLAIVQWVVRSHEGSVRVESVVGEGTTFVLSFPRHVVGHASRDGIHA